MSKPVLVVTTHHVKEVEERIDQNYDARRNPNEAHSVGKVNAEFFADGKWKVNLICNLGYGDADADKLFPMNPRLEFEEAARVL
jgi:hypothetical protein